MKNTLRSSALACALAVAVASPLAALGEELPMDQAIAAAKTPADHEAIAARYDAEASALDAKIKEHSSMSNAYKAWGKSGHGFEAHCDKLVNALTDARAQYGELGKMHKQMATEHK